MRERDNRPVSDREAVLTDAEKRRGTAGSIVMDVDALAAQSRIARGSSKRVCPAEPRNYARVCLSRSQLYSVHTAEESQSREHKYTRRRREIIGRSTDRFARSGVRQLSPNPRFVRTCAKEKERKRAVPIFRRPTERDKVSSADFSGRSVDKIGQFRFDCSCKC